MIILTLNSGSSSLKFGLYQVDGSELRTLVSGEQSDGIITAQDASGAALSVAATDASTLKGAIRAIGALQKSEHSPVPNAIGHRIVHGGAKLREHCLINEQVKQDLAAAAAMSPLHAPAALNLIRLAGEAWPGVPQAACLDTAFHANMPAQARTLPVARELQDLGVQRYGFHGLSCASILRQLGSALPSRTIIAHLGSGASVTAVRDGRSVDTSMGLTPSGGVVMGTRSGDLDPGVLLYLMRAKGYDATALETDLDHLSGLLGISGQSSDMRELHRVSGSSAQARLAIDMFCLSTAKAIAGMMVTLGGADLLVFTGGIGAHDSAVRAEICGYLSWVGVADADGSEGSTGLIRSACHVRILPSREDDEIAWHTNDLVTSGKRDSIQA